MVKIGRILDSLNFGSANGPLVRGRRSAVHEICSPEAQICRKGKCGKSAYGPQTVRGSSVQPVSFGYTGGVFNEKSADGPPWVRGRSAVVEKNLLEAVPSGVCQIFQSRTVRLGIADSPHLHRNVGPATHGLICSSPFLLPPNRAHTIKSPLSFSLKHLGETSRSKIFGVVPGRSEHIPGLFSRFSIMSSRYFTDSSPYVLGFHHERG